MSVAGVVDNYTVNILFEIMSLKENGKEWGNLCSTGTS